jgi:hypothetical protein
MELECLNDNLQTIGERRHTFRATDGSDLSFYAVEAPTTAQAHLIGQTGCNPAGPPDGVDIEFSKMSLIRHVRCGNRGSDQSHYRWSSNVTHTVYAHECDIVIARMSGLGPEFFLLRQLDTKITWPVLCDVLAEPRLWDVCATLVGTHERARATAIKATEQEWKAAFLEGRIRKRRGRADVVLLPARPVAA